jgi:type I restriction enzyme R subunit
MSEDEIKKGFEKFKEERNDAILSKIAEKNGVEFNALKNFVNETLQRLVFDSDKFDELFESQDLGWKERTQKQLSMMEELEPVFKKMSDGHVIAGLSAYEQ